MIFFVHHPFIGQLILQKSKLIFQRRKVCDCRKPKIFKKCKISRLTHSKKTKMQLSWWSFKPSTWVTKFPAASLVISAINREKFEEWSEWFKSSKISTFAQVTSFYLHFSQSMYVCVDALKQLYRFLIFSRNLHFKITFVPWLSITDWQSVFEIFLDWIYTGIWRIFVWNQCSACNEARNTERCVGTI